MSHFPLRESRNGRTAAVLGSLAVTGILLAGCSSAATKDTAAGASAPQADKELAALLPAAVRKAGTVKLGALWETPPLISVAASDTTKPVGVAPDLAAAVGKLLGVSVTWKNLQWPAQLPGVQSGTVDALWGQVTATEEREKSIVDLVPFYKSTESILLLDANKSGVSALADLCGKKIGVPVGSIQATAVKAASKKSCADNPIKLAQYNGATAAISAVKAGSVFGWLDDTTSQDKIVQAGSGTFAAAVVPDGEMPPTYNSIAVGKNQAGLSKAFAAALKKLVANGEYAKIMAKYEVTSAEVTAAEVKINPITGTPAGSKA
ncbi:transporter substrate-binding domain-containing protein [Streptomyces sp. NPDC047000]|uniref:transporter substrate-binding domain-containing protein n=1 Tax=Streptomyces sp. NPDC047000 TaxID=3155474 RepID=UPI0033E6FC1E